MGFKLTTDHLQDRLSKEGKVSRSFNGVQFKLTTDHLQDRCSTHYATRLLVI